jgi:hypothetical protein
MEHSVRMQSIVQRVGNRVLGMRGRSFQVGRTGISERSNTSGSECAIRAGEVTARFLSLSGVEGRERTYLIKFVT